MLEFVEAPLLALLQNVNLAILLFAFFNLFVSCMAGTALCAS